MDAKIIARKLIVYISGLFILAFGISIARISDLGMSPINSVAYVLAKALDTDQGRCTTCLFFLYIFMQIVLKRREYKIINLLQIGVSFLFGYFVNVTNIISDTIFPVTGSYPLSFFYALLSIVVVSLGVTLHLEGKIITMPAEGLILVLVEKTHQKYAVMKVALDITMVILTVIVSFTFLGHLDGIREGTFIASFGVGYVLNIIMPPMHSVCDRFIYGKA